MIAYQVISLAAGSYGNGGSSEVVCYTMPRPALPVRSLPVPFVCFPPASTGFT